MMMIMMMIMMSSILPIAMRPACPVVLCQSHISYKPKLFSICFKPRIFHAPRITAVVNEDGAM